MEGRGGEHRSEQRKRKFSERCNAMRREWMEYLHDSLRDLVSGTYDIILRWLQFKIASIVTHSVSESVKLFVFVLQFFDSALFIA